MAAGEPEQPPPRRRGAPAPGRAAPLLGTHDDAVLAELRARIGAARLGAAASARELLELYWEIGRVLHERQAREGWEAVAIARLARGVRAEFPGARGFSARNLARMLAFYRAYAARSRVLPEPLAEAPWAHHVALLEKLDDPEERSWYARESRARGWSTRTLVHHIDSGLFRRSGNALSNFGRTLPPAQSALAQALLKHLYVFDFLPMGAALRERELEEALVARVRSLLQELGEGFAFVDNQHRLQVGEEDFYLDLLFYHLHLRCFVVIDLKLGDFRPEHTGQMSFYLAAVDDLLRRPGDQPSIGIILCRACNRVIVEYALRDLGRPVGVSTYQLTLRRNPAGDDGDGPGEGARDGRGGGRGRAVGAGGGVPSAADGARVRAAGRAGGAGRRLAARVG